MVEEPCMVGDRAAIIREKRPHHILHTRNHNAHPPMLFAAALLVRLLPSTFTKVAFTLLLGSLPLLPTGAGAAAAAAAAGETAAAPPSKNGTSSLSLTSWLSPPTSCSALTIFTVARTASRRASWPFPHSVSEHVPVGATNFLISSHLVLHAVAVLVQFFLAALLSTLSRAATCSHPCGSVSGREPATRCSRPGCDSDGGRTAVV